jgi:hypothetical protein
MAAWIRVTAAVIAVVVPSVTGAEQLKSQADSTPRFEDYRVELIPPVAGRSTEAIVAREAGMESLRRVAKEGPDFAGRYALVKSTCGTGCAIAVIVNVRTGKIYNPPFVGASQCGSIGSTVLSYRVNSRLLIVTGSLEIPDKAGETFRDGPCGRFYYVWTGSRLKLIRSELAGPQQTR